MNDKTKSPEETGHYECSECHNRERFTGIDANGYGGRDSCTCYERECDCMTELTQDFDVIEQGENADAANINYHAFTGGDSGAEIGSYTTILCRDCGTTIWQEAENVA